MLTITCDKSGISETFDLADVEVREGKREGEWQWVIKGIEKLQHFAPNAIDRELNMVLSKKAKADWEKEDKQLKEKALSDRIKIVKKMQQLKVQNTTNNMTTK